MEMAIFDHLCRKQSNQVMGKVKITREEALAKFQAAKNKKRECLKQLEKSMKEIYKKETGKEAESFFAV